MRLLTISSAALASFLLVACGDGGGDAKPASSGTSKPAAATSAKPAASSAAKPAPTTTATAAAADAGDDIPTEEDFEDEAEKEITKESMADELAKLEKEVDSDKE